MARQKPGRVSSTEGRSEDAGGPASEEIAEEDPHMPSPVAIGTNDLDRSGSFCGATPVPLGIKRPSSTRPPERRLRLVRPDETGTIPSPVSRLAAILAADVVGYARHMAEDEIGTHARLTVIFRDLVAPRLARHDGRLVKGTGDGFLAEFGCATRAAWFAVEFQRAARAWNARRRRGRRLEFRVGINLGDVIVEGHDVFGHSVNIAARLESLAEPGGVLVSYPVCAAIRDPGLRFDDIGELALKNLDEAVRGYRLRPSGGASGLSHMAARAGFSHPSWPGLARPPTS